MIIYYDIIEDTNGVRKRRNRIHLRFRLNDNCCRYDIDTKNSTEKVLQSNGDNNKGSMYTIRYGKTVEPTNRFGWINVKIMYRNCFNFRL